MESAPSPFTFQFFQKFWERFQNMKFSFEGTFDEYVDWCGRLYVSLGGDVSKPPVPQRDDPPRFEVDTTQVASRSHDDLYYRVTMVNDIAVACSCPHYVYRGMACWHMMRAVAVRDKPHGGS